MQNSGGINVRHTARFLKSFKRLPKDLQEKVTARDLLFRKNPFDTRLVLTNSTADFRDIGRTRLIIITG